MKNFLFILLVTVVVGTSNNVCAQTEANQVEIATNYKATKAQKKLIRKINKYVSLKFVTKDMREAGLIGKTVKVQMNLDEQGQISALTAIKGIESSIDNRVMQLIKDFDAEHPIAQSAVEKPSVLQLNVPLVAKQYFNSK